MTRHINAPANFAAGEINFRDNDWFGACPQLDAAGKTAARARGEVKRLEIARVSGTRFEFAEEVVPGDRYLTVDATRPVKVLEFANQHGKYKFWGQQGVDPTVIEITVWFDIPGVNDDPAT